MRRLLRHVLRATALAALLPATAAVAQEKEPAKAPVRSVAQTPEAALFAKYGGLDAASTRELLAAVKADPARAKVVTRVADALAAPNVKAADIEADLLKLVKGLEPAQISPLLDVVMRHHYDLHVATRPKAASAAALGKELERKDHALEGAVYGKAAHKKRHLAAKRLHARR